MTLTKATDINALILYLKKKYYKKRKKQFTHDSECNEKKINSENFKKCPAISQTAQS